jgi:hypothetical protein
VIEQSICTNERFEIKNIGRKGGMMKQLGVEGIKV